MLNVPILTESEFIGRVKATLDQRPFQSSYSSFDLTPIPIQPAAFVLILGAGFSYGIVPLVKELMQATIGDYYFPDQSGEGSFEDRPLSIRQRDSANFWKEFNQAAAHAGFAAIEVDHKGLPADSGEAYRLMFKYDVLNRLFAIPEHNLDDLDFFERIHQGQMQSLTYGTDPGNPSNRGERFLKGFLRYVLAPGSEFGYGWTGRNRLNDAHIYLAGLLEAQQLGRGWKTCAFCRTLFTTNFDSLLQIALQMVHLLYRITDRPETGFDPADFLEGEGPVHLVYTHGSILRHNPASTLDELGGLASKNSDVLRDVLQSHDVIAVGYGGWDDGLMRALGSSKTSQHKVYWCDVTAQPTPRVAEVLSDRAGEAFHVQMTAGADGLMRTLYETLVAPEAQRDMRARSGDWYNLVWNRT